MKAERIDFNHYVSTVAHRWADQYFTHGRWQYCGSGPAELIYTRLLAKGSDITAEEADGIIGNSHWNYLYCDGCDERLQEDLVSVGDAPDIDTANCKLCKACVLEALAAFDEVNHE